MLDKLDKDILHMLLENSRISAQKIAKKLGLHTNTVIKRIKKLEQNGVIKKYGTDINYRAIGWDVHALVLIKVGGGVAGDKDQIKSITDIKEVEAVYATTGNFDLVVFCRARNRKHLLEIIKNIADHPIVLRTSTQIILYKYKGPFDFNPF